MKLFTKLDAALQPLPDDAVEFAAIHVHKTETIVAALNLKDGARLKHAAAERAAAGLEHCGQKDWRLPDLEELEAIRDLTRYDPAVDPAFFPFIKSDWYWTRTPAAYDPSGCAWYVYFAYGSSYWGNRNNNARAFAVRSARQDD